MRRLRATAGTSQRLYWIENAQYRHEAEKAATQKKAQQNLETSRNGAVFYDEDDDNDHITADEHDENVIEYNWIEEQDLFDNSLQPFFNLLHHLRQQRSLHSMRWGLPKLSRSSWMGIPIIGM